MIYVNAEQAIELMREHGYELHFATGDRSTKHMFARAIARADAVLHPSADKPGLRPVAVNVQSARSLIKKGAVVEDRTNGPVWTIYKIVA